MVDMRKKFSFGVWNFDTRADRFMPTGYRREKSSVIEMIDEAGKIPGLNGLEFIYPNYVCEDNLKEIQAALQRNNLEVSLVLPNFHGEPIWQHGTFAAMDDGIRKQSIDRMKAAMDISAQLGANLVNLWPGQDGYDYAFQADFIGAWERFIDAVATCADHRPDVRLALEYKIKEPRTHSLLGTVGKTLLVINEVKRDNVGVTIDVGHSLGAYENVAESAVLLHQYGKRLYHFHLNDNYRAWDDDMIVGSVHTIEYLELLYWLERVGYDGWYSLDIYPYREDASKSVNASFNALRGMLRLLDRIGIDTISEHIVRGDITDTLELVRKAMLP